MSVKFEITKTEKGEYHFKLLDSGGKTLLRSEGYNAKASCTNGIESVRRNAVDDARYDLKSASDGRPYFNLKASNGQIIGTSPMFADAHACATAVAATKSAAAGAAVDDKS
ncbi:YegP family protein [Thauera aromatica]|uniref:YegP family protein n=1 Tax=Thauera aromatica TaxID=59405 RepID=UPI001FFD30EA|nr:YegP family protein [Thauera aromatica]MCK2087400.1 YegP family protein [Thauera aromatica]MCK2126398.1 YegP family protein [Thauera aromatica]